MSKLRIRVETDGYTDVLDVTIRDMDDSVSKTLVNKIFLQWI